MRTAAETKERARGGKRAVLYCPNLQEKRKIFREKAGSKERKKNKMEGKRSVRLLREN